MFLNGWLWPDCACLLLLLDCQAHGSRCHLSCCSPRPPAPCCSPTALAHVCRVLDVGSGCGVIAASAAYLVGKAGTVTGVDVRRAAITLGRENLARLEQSNSDFAASAAACKFHLHNVFMPLRKHLVSLWGWLPCSTA